MRSRVIISISVIVCVIVISLLLINLSDRSKVADSLDNDTNSVRIEISASWAYGYPDIMSLTYASDLIGVIEVIDIDSVEIIGEYEQPAIYMTTYLAKVYSAILAEDEVIRIVMTGKNDDEQLIEIADDPLMVVGEKWLIFARLNDRQSYTILSGPNGRFSYNEANDTITSLPNSPIIFLESSLSELKNEILSYLDITADD